MQDQRKPWSEEIAVWSFISSPFVLLFGTAFALDANGYNGAWATPITLGVIGALCILACIPLWLYAALAIGGVVYALGAPLWAAVLVALFVPIRVRG